MALAAVATAPAAGKKTIKLTKPIETHAGRVYELTFAPITAGIVIRNKRNPFATTVKANGDRVQDVDFELAAKYICDLTGLDEITIGQLDSNDFGECVTHLFDVLMLGKN